MRALVVEDDLKSQCLLAKVLAEGSHEVTTFENAEQAILEYQKEFYPLLFVDVGLPGMDGLQFCSWIRRQPRGGATYVIAAVDPNVPNELPRVLEAGANDFLTKPYQLDQLRARLVIGERQMAQFFERQRLEQNLQDESRALEADREVKGSLESKIASQNEDLDRLREEIGGLWDRCAKLEQTLEASRQECEALQARVHEAEQALEFARLEVAKARPVAGGLLDSMQEALRNREEELARMKHELTEAREERARRLQEQTEQLAKLSEQMRLSLEDRKQTEIALAAAHDQLMRRGRQQVDESLRRADEIDEMLQERRRLEQALECRDEQREAEQKRLMAERDEVGRRLTAEAEESARLRVALAQAKEQASTRAGDHESMTEEVKVHRDARRRLESRWRLLLRLGTQLNRARTAEEVARVAGRGTHELVGWDLFSLDAYLAEGDWIHPVLSLESRDGESRDAEPPHSGPQPTSLMRRVLEDGAQIIVRPESSGLHTDLVVMDHRSRRSVSLLCVPIATGDRVIGFLSARSGVDHAYDVADLETLELVAALCAASLERIELASAGDHHRVAEARGETAMGVQAGS
jgi:DNA-binding response OmpR family regulator